MTTTADTPAAAEEVPVDAALLERLLAGQDLSREHAAGLLRTIMRGEVADAPLAAVLVALRAKGESAAEIAGFVETMIAHAAPIDLASSTLVDTCGTGGDGADTFNISTLAAVVVAAAGVPVAKHGNRSASSACGSADLLEQWGVVIDLPGEHVATCVRELGIGFLFARTFHPAMRHVGPVRGALGIRTVFNVLGPLSNPADAHHRVVGVADERLAPVMAAALADLGKRALVFRGEDGLDELTTTAPSQLWTVQDGIVTAGRFDPLEHGIERATLADLHGGSVERNVAIAEAVLGGAAGPQADIVALNAAAALVTTGAAATFVDGIAVAREVLGDGRARDLRDRWVARTQELAAAGTA